MIRITIPLDQELYPETENILKACINDALGRYVSYNPEKVKIEEVKQFAIGESVANIGSYIHSEAFQKFGLHAEVITFALQYMKENPSLTIEQAFAMGCDEWDV